MSMVCWKYMELDLGWSRTYYTTVIYLRIIKLTLNSVVVAEGLLSSCCQLCFLFLCYIVRANLLGIWTRKRSQGQVIFGFFIHGLPRFFHYPSVVSPMHLRKDLLTTPFFYSYDFLLSVPWRLRTYEWVDCHQQKKTAHQNSSGIVLKIVRKTLTQRTTLPWGW